MSRSDPKSHMQTYLLAFDRLTCSLIEPYVSDAANPFQFIEQLTLHAEAESGRITDVEANPLPPMTCQSDFDTTVRFP